MLTLKDVHLAYGPIAAVRNASIHVDTVEVVAIVGGNGAGKSTLLKGIAALMPVGSGLIHFYGEDISRLAPHKRVARGIALSPERLQVFPYQSVYYYLTLFSYFRRLPNDALYAEVEEQFKLFPRLREQRYQLAVTLSGSEQQMLSISRALMSKPRLLLLYEPSLCLAPKIIQYIFYIIVSLRLSGITILLV